MLKVGVLPDLINNLTLYAAAVDSCRIPSSYRTWYHSAPKATPIPPPGTMYFDIRGSGLKGPILPYRNVFDVTSPSWEVPRA